ncbi:CaiF/GrlA family transcriptional regulator [Salmonella enterica subsp. enterica]|nr:CaiF/GrlA family transcriptional regulator [Salmonella enterica subsp. enterica serovar Mikawasima]ECB5946149.1 CaiF/GrlA family transcriptional regulator [Salmonella enterica subsp. enterica serovar Mikawasima]EEC0866401.1 CaiF/GrlA family transcriptional regulator [Salmonella enterica subsp. enterica serovar Mikawasima]EGZ4543983.1 CaiF/GrlA family transcriptional regulator [Salmonella enterica subsp. enterica serovar Mikawasima]EIK6983096.1 CaiF/GrlA family transcriptional regulator [Salm
METDRVLVRVRDEFSHILPPVVADMIDQPLYIVVAMWGLREDTLLTTKVVSRTFLLTQGRARDILHYIVHEGRSHVVCNTLILSSENSGNDRCRALKIMQVNKASPDSVRRIRTSVLTKSSSIASVRDIPTGSMSELQSLRRWMCIRRTGEVWLPNGNSEE